LLFTVDRHAVPASLKLQENCPTEDQEKVIGRTKLADIEFDDAVKPTTAHNALTTIIEDGQQLEIVRNNMPFGEVGKGEFATYFIGYARSPRRIDQMPENVFVGRPPGNYDRLLDFSRAVTGSLFFVPSATWLEDVAPGAGRPTAGTRQKQSAKDISIRDLRVMLRGVRCHSRCDCADSAIAGLVRRFVRSGKHEFIRSRSPFWRNR
jgi:hypothetical protein